MDFQTIAQFIWQVGFPIAVCCYLFYSKEKESVRHTEEMAKMNEALNNNTLAIQHLSDTLAKH